jgi:hypothetical protein
MSYHGGFGLTAMRAGAVTATPVVTGAILALPGTTPKTTRPYNQYPKTMAEFHQAYAMWVSYGGMAKGWPPPVKPPEPKPTTMISLVGAGAGPPASAMMPGGAPAPASFGPPPPPSPKTPSTPLPGLCPDGSPKFSSETAFGTACINQGGSIIGRVCTLPSGAKGMLGTDGCPVPLPGVPGAPTGYPSYYPTAKPSMMVPLALGAGVLALMLLR